MKVVLLCLAVVLSAGACKKSGGGGGGGGGGGWLVGASGLMINVQATGSTSGYSLASTESLNFIGCRYDNEAWVVGNHGTLLYTNDGGASWNPQSVPTTANLRALATQDFGPVFVAGDGVFLTSTDTGAHWTALGDGSASFRSLAAAQGAETVLAVSEGGGLWRVEHQQLIASGTMAGARAVAVSPDGQTAVLVGDNLVARSSDGGLTWSPLALAESARFDGVRVDENGEAIAVGAAGALAHISAAGKVTVQHLGTTDLHAIHVSEAGEDDESIGFAAGEPGRVWLTRDGGTTWSPGPMVTQAVFGADVIGKGHL
jgi:photosystem II stability/assembly factor-like uncharacterized protein